VNDIAIIKMKEETKTQIKEALIGGAIAFVITWVACGCKTTPQHDFSDRYRYYVIDVNGSEPDAVFDDIDDAESYVEDFKEFHNYRIVKGQ